MEYYDAKQKRWVPYTPSKVPMPEQQNIANASVNVSLEKLTKNKALENTSFVELPYSNLLVGGGGANNLDRRSNHGK